MTKKTTLLLNLAVLSTLGLATGCNEANTEKVKSSTSTSKANSLIEEGKTSEAAEVYARIGEILLGTPQGIFHSEEMFSKSLSINPNNERANIYSAVLAPQLTLKGYLKRFNILDNSKNKSNIAQSEKEINKLGLKEFTDFFLVMPKGTVEAKNMEDLRKFVRNEYVKELDNSIKKLEKIKEANLVLALDLNQYNKNKVKTVVCTVDTAGEYICDDEKAFLYEAKYNVDKYDIKALSIILRTQRNALTIVNSIGLQGFEDVVAKVKALSNKSDREVVAAIKSQPKLLKLEGTRQDVVDIFDHVEETMNDLIDFSKISKEVCNSVERKDNLANSICVSEEAAEKIRDALTYVVGPKEVVLGVDAKGEDVTVEVNARALIDSQVANLQELLPTKFDSAGKAIAVKDLTFKGIIPNADLIKKLKTVVK